MAALDLYDICLPVLGDPALDDDDRADALEALIRKESDLAGKALEAAVLDVLRQYRNGGARTAAGSTLRKKPAWQQQQTKEQQPAVHVQIPSFAQQPPSRSSTPQGASPRTPTASPTPNSLPRPSFLRIKSMPSPFASPKNSPRPGFLNMYPYSPGLDAYEFNSTSKGDVYDLDSSNIDSLLADDAVPMTPGARAALAEWMPSNTVEMSPYDILRSVIRDDKSDADIEAALETNGYDLSAAMAAFMDAGDDPLPPPTPRDKTFTVGKSMASSRPGTPGAQQKSPVVCRYWLSTGQCLRADCRFSHDLSHHVCKYWIQGNCLAGNACIFSHDPALLMSSMSLASPGLPMSPGATPFQGTDYLSFPSLGAQASQPATPSESSLRYLSASNHTPGDGLPRSPLAPEFVPGMQSLGPRSPGIGLDDGDAFPSLSSAAAAGAGQRTARKHHGKRGHGHTNSRDKEIQPPSLLADVLRMAPPPALSPGPTSAPLSNPRRTLRGTPSYTGTREHSMAALGIPAPERLPWLETGERANREYLRARAEAIKHGAARNKFLQGAAQAWHRNDTRAAKALSLRGQAENQLMRDAHRAAAQALYDERNAKPASAAAEETYVDLHGLHPAEAVSYLATALVAQRALPRLKLERETDRMPPASARFVYAIVGAGHHSRGGRDKVGRAVRAYLTECRFAYREFGMPGERPATGGGGYFAQAPGGGATPSATSSGASPGGILGIDVTSGDLARDAVAREASAGKEDAVPDSNGAAGAAGTDDTPLALVPPPLPLSAMLPGKVRILKADPRRASPAV